MVVLGPATAIAMQRAQLRTPESDPSFLAAELLAIVAFAGLVTAAFAFRNNASTHKRLILLATIVDRTFADVSERSYAQLVLDANSAEVDRLLAPLAASKKFGLFESILLPRGPHRVLLTAANGVLPHAVRR